MNGSVLVVPDFSVTGANEKLEILKKKCEDTKPIGLARVSKDENLVVYEGKHSEKYFA